MSDIGDSNRITREYIDSLLIETRYLDGVVPDTSYTLYGREFPSPIMTASLSHLDSFMFPGAADALAQGMRDFGGVLWYGMAEDSEIERLFDICPHMIEIIKPYRDRDTIFRKIAFAEKLGLLAVGIDIDHSFGPDGSHDLVHDIEMAPLTAQELRDICALTPLPVIVKGVLSRRDAEKCLAAGVRGMVISHHNNRIGYAVPPLAVLPEIAALAGKDVPLFVDCEIRTGMDAYKALALGASGVCIGRALMAAIKKDGAAGVRDHLLQANAELKKAMAFTGCADLNRMDPSVIRRL